MSATQRIRPFPGSSTTLVVQLLRSQSSSRSASFQFENIERYARLFNLLRRRSHCSEKEKGRREGKGRGGDGVGGEGGSSERQTALVLRSDLVFLHIFEILVEPSLE